MLNIGCLLTFKRKDLKDSFYLFGSRARYDDIVSIIFLGREAQIATTGNDCGYQYSCLFCMKNGIMFHANCNPKSFWEYDEFELFLKNVKK